MAQIIPIDPLTFEAQSYSQKDEGLILKTPFNSNLDLTGYIEFYSYDNNEELLDQNINYNNYKVENSGTSTSPDNVQSIIIDPAKDLETLAGDGGGEYISFYNFLNLEIGNQTQELYISEISSDRTEIRLESNDLIDIDFVEQSEDFIDKREESEYFLDFYLNFSNNILIIANNLKLENEETDNPSVLIKLYEPLPIGIQLKSKLFIVTKFNESTAYKAIFPPEPTFVQGSRFMKGPNFAIPVKNQVNNSTENLSYNNIISNSSSNSQNQIQSLLEEKSINLSVNYNNFSDFINFSSAQTRIENFYYKVGLIENYNSEINVLNNITGSSTSKQIIDSKISNITKNFDQFEYFMYYSSGSMVSYPKSTTNQPYTLYPSTSSQVLTWLGSINETSGNFGGLLLSASNYDNENPDQLKKTIPEYLREDPSNQPYDLFVDMVAQYYDNIWLYTKDITQKYNADNRLDFGVSKDLVSDAIKDFGLKLYQNNFSNKELYTAFLGITPSGSLFPFPEITESLPAPTGFEYVNTLISASNDIISMDDTNKSLYKRIYHNIPYLLKSKGTLTGLRALITSYGIPDTILKISEFGGKDQVNANDYDLYFNNFNYALNTKNNNNITTLWGDNTINPGINKKWKPNPNYDGLESGANTIQFRFKAEEITSIKSPYGLSNIRQTLWDLTSNGSIPDNSQLYLDYPGSGLSKNELYSGSIPDPNYKNGRLVFLPTSKDPSRSAIIELPFFDGGWWSVQIKRINNTTFVLSAGNKIYNNNTGTSIGFYSTSSINGNVNSWNSSYLSNFAKTHESSLSTNFPGFSGSLQEIRYYTTIISESVFKDYIMNPLSFEGNGINGSPDQLIFRAALGSELLESIPITSTTNNLYGSAIYGNSNYGVSSTSSSIFLNQISTSSIHPKVTGSWSITSSFLLSSNFNINSPTNFINNVESFFLDQPAVGIKNRTTDKIRSENATIPGNTLSPIKSLAQNTEASASYTDNVNYLEVAFSPQNQINDDIIGQMGHFNIGDYIGDPRERFTGNNYPDLNNLSEEYFKKYIKNYDLVDFVRLIKFFDNSLFKMIKDFVPVRTSLASGLVIKQHLLERNKYSQPQVSYSEEDLTGCIKSYKVWNTASQETEISCSRIATTEGGPAGMFNPFNVNYDSATTVISGSNTFTYNWYTSGFSSVSETLLGSTAEVTVDSTGFVTNTDILKFLDFRDTTGENNPNLWLKYTSSPAVYPLFYFNTLNNYVSYARVQNIQDIGGGSYRITLATGYGFAQAIPAGTGESKTSGIFQFISSSLNANSETFSETIPFTSSITDYTFETQPQFNVTQSWSVTTPTLYGSITSIHDSQDEFYNGELSGSTLIVSNGELNEGDAEFKTINPKGASYGIRFYDTGSGYNFNDFINPLNNPYNGFIQMWYQENQSATAIPAPNPGGGGGGNTNI
jgi:hypothetical protein